ncbi:hypothetical protein IRJ41_005412 [Triplophysa rosa]|uniref:Immunoglobulin V-set domain-containing protein n=1 Tax=Triplophysa rosa TaxID=992332 RepID=A0A9W7T5L6_TRIRA|nr:hypothetical protein IRJ41_005412 [Triplophysa rosa]
MNTISLLFIISFINGVFGDEVKTVMEGDSVTLHTDLTDMTGVIRIIWRVGEEDSYSFLCGINENKTIDVYNNDVRFRGRLQVNNQNGDLTIKNMRVKHSGRYQAEINYINRAGTTYKNFRVTVCDADTFEEKSVTERHSVTLPTDVQTHRDDLIVWRFGDEGLLIAKHDKEDNKSSIYDGEGFRDRLKLDDHTGEFTTNSFVIFNSFIEKCTL